MFFYDNLNFDLTIIKWAWLKILRVVQHPLIQNPGYAPGPYLYNIIPSNMVAV